MRRSSTSIISRFVILLHIGVSVTVSYDKICLSIVGPFKNTVISVVCWYGIDPAFPPFKLEEIPALSASGTLLICISTAELPIPATDPGAVTVIPPLKFKSDTPFANPVTKPLFLTVTDPAVFVPSARTISLGNQYLFPVPLLSEATIYQS